MRRTLAERVARSRRYPRRIMARFGPEGTEHKGLVENLSDQGLLLTSNRIFAPRTRLSIQLLVLPDPVRLEGVVQWARQVPLSCNHVVPSGMGVRLLAAPPDFLRLVSELESTAGATSFPPSKATA